ncbi:MAG: GNAT family N-acetyltransferase [Actinomycetota bacterium]|nr:GNAT family N-acetyltransferase [Actinomycetota bacterium]
MLVDRALVRRIEGMFARDAAEYAYALRTIDPTSLASVAECAGGRLVYLGPGMFVNRAFGVGIDRPATATDVDMIVEFFAARDCVAEIELCPYAHDAVRARAVELGFGMAWFRNVYAYTLLDGHIPPLNSPVECIPVDTTNFAVWESFWVQNSVEGPGIVQSFARARHRKPGEHDFIVTSGSEVVAVCSMTISGELADLGGMTTRPTFRRQGVQAACLAHRLSVARQAGCDLAVTSADPGGESARNIERAGFRCLYTSVGLRRSLDR